MQVECPHIHDYSNYTKSLQGKSIYKDQCVRCFHYPRNESGLYICMKCFNGFCLEDMYAHIADHNHFLYINMLLLERKQEQQHEINKIAIGVPGGALAADEYDTTYKVYCGSCKSHELAYDKLLDGQVQSLANTDSPFKKQSLVSWYLEIHPCEHTLTLQQHLVNNNLMCCANCYLSTNLWLCLTCGNTGCGRKNWDGTGGNGHAMMHFENSHHPLVVKLGTITSEGEASIYCYSCNNDVKDYLLSAHLAVLGIAVKEQKKTERTIAELSLDLNLNFSLSKLLEGKDHDFEIAYGGDNTGINNIGNSCYINSVLQMLNSLPEVRHLYSQLGKAHMLGCKKIPSTCFYCQVSKIFYGLNSGKYSQKQLKTKMINNYQHTEEYQPGITPYDFKLLLAKGNPYFSSCRQQDALEYLQYMFDRLEKEYPFYSQQNITKLFDYTAVNRLICRHCNGYKLVYANSNEWKLPMPHPTQYDIDLYFYRLQKEDPDTRKSKYCEDPYYDVEFSACLNLYKHGDNVTAFCQNCKANQMFDTHQYFLSTPKYLLVVPNRFVLYKWVPKKLNALINIHEELDLSSFAFVNAPPAGKLLGEDVKPAYSEENLATLISMGLNVNAAKRALIATKDNIEAVFDWIANNSYNSNLYAPLYEHNSGPSTIDQYLVLQVTYMGFDESQAKIALIKHKSNVQAAVEWLFNIGGDVSEFNHLLDAAAGSKTASKTEIKPLAFTRYELKAVIVHLGKSVHNGHYVSYVRKGGKWVLFNDETVTIRKNPMLGKGYVYVYYGKY